MVVVVVVNEHWLGLSVYVEAVWEAGEEVQCGAEVLGAEGGG